MAKVKVLVEGYTNADREGFLGEEKTCPTMSLVIDKDIVMVVDPGVISDQQILADALADLGVSVDDVNIVAITQTHTGHTKNMGMFPNARILEAYGIWQGD